MRKKLLSILVLSILVASTLVGCAPSTLTILSITEGNVSVMKAGTGSWIEAQVGMSLEPGDSVKTGDDSSAIITFFDGSTIELQAGTEIEIASLDISTDTGSTTITLKQTIGNTISRVVKLVDPASRYEVETPTGVAAVRGSVMQVYVIEDGTTWIINQEGDIWAVAQSVELQIPEGRECIIIPGRPPELLYFADRNLEAAIREAIGKPEGPIYPSDLGGLTSLDASERSISDLKGLEQCTNLTWLWLRKNQISDIWPLANLTNLTELYLGDNQISDISPLANLTNLTHLGLYNNQISNISPLANLANLTQLHLPDNQITDISPLTNLTNLREVHLGDNQISDISPLANLTNLTWLNLDSNQISNTSPLANLASLTWLMLFGNQISDISALASLTNLTELSLGTNQISNISPLANLASLTWLGLYQNQISDINALVQNEGLGAGDLVCLWGNPLNSDSISVYIPQLQARGVAVDIDYPCG